MFKKLFSFLIILSMTLALFTGLPISVSAEGEADNKCGDTVTWSLENGVLEINGTGNMYNYNYNNHAPWYDSRSGITSVVISDDVTLIGSYVFYDCKNLTSVNIPNGVTLIGSYTFNGCKKLTSVTIPESVTSIDRYAFYNCSSLETVFYPDTCTNVADNAFGGTTNATLIKYNVNGDKLTITDIIPKENETSVTIGKMDGDYSNMTADTIIYKSGLTVNGDIVPPTTTKIEYTENDGKITISKIEVPNGGKAEIPAKINGMDVVAVAEDYQEFVDKTKHTTHTYENDVCTICGKEKEENKPNTGDDDNNNDDNNDDNNNDGIDLKTDGSTLTIGGTGAVNSGDLSAAWNEEEYGDMGDITDVVIEDGITSVGDGAFDGFENLETVYYQQGTTVSENAFPEDVTQVEYSVNGDGDVIIEDIKQGDVISDGDKVVIPDKIGGMDVAGVDEEVRHLVSDTGHEHKGGTARF